MTTNTDEDPYAGLTPEQARAKFDELNKPSKDYSHASKSPITSIDEDIQKPEAAEPQVDLDNITAAQPVTKGDFLKALENVGEIFNSQIKKLDEMNVQRINQLSADFQMTIQQLQGVQAPPQDKKEQFMETVLEMGKEYLTQNKQQAPPNEFEQQLMENYKKEAMESINIVSLINRKVKASLTGKVASTVADSVLEAAEPVVKHGA